MCLPQGAWSHNGRMQVPPLFGRKAHKSGTLKTIPPLRCRRGRNLGGSNAKRGMSIKGERIGEQRIGGDILEKGNFAGEKNKRSVASSELRAWGKASAL
ncbi:hypothetical protein CK203_105319 [Vitis vinifera]|uniref:Uncharacterized protein n=1 Tax=Vitis vinifera TaxID=29760 RepID=A0A438CD62_VITVI|nr:hypothetical protein CK203_105319 [Vitis vinifera]